MHRKKTKDVLEEKERAPFSYKAAIYCRLSDEDKRDFEDNSIGNQQKICMSFVESHTDIEVVDTYIDNGYSGGDFCRPDFLRMAGDIETGRINCIIVKDLSRFGRNYIETSEYLEKCFPVKGIRFIAVNNGYDNSLDGWKGILIPFYNIVNEMYLRDTSRKIRSSIEVMMKKGEFLPASGSIPYGYVRDKKNCTYLVDEEAAGIVRLIFNKKKEGCSNCFIAAYLNEAGVPSPGKLRFLRGMSKDRRNETALWTHKMIKEILKNETYLGFRIHGKVKSRAVGTAKTRREKEEWGYIPNAHPAIIEKELFDTVCRILEEESRKRGDRQEHGSVPTERRELFLHKVYCGDCGSLMSTMKQLPRKNSRKEPKVYYQCNGYAYSGRTRCCNHYLSQKKLEEVVANALYMQISVIADLEKIGKMRLFQSETDSLSKKLRESRNEISRKLRVLEGRMDTLFENLNSGMLEPEEFRYIKEKYQEEGQRLKQQRLQAESELEAAMAAAGKRKKWLDMIGDFRKKPMLNRDLIDGLIGRVQVYADRSVEIEFRFRDEYEQAIQLAGRGGES